MSFVNDYLKARKRSDRVKWITILIIAGVIFLGHAVNQGYGLYEKLSQKVIYKIELGYGLPYGNNDNIKEKVKRSVPQASDVEVKWKDETAVMEGENENDFVELLGEVAFPHGSIDCREEKVLKKAGYKLIDGDKSRIYRLKNTIQLQKVVYTLIIAFMCFSFAWILLLQKS